MKNKTVDLDHRTTVSRRNRWFQSYNNCINSPRCNKLFAVIFMMSISGIFIASIILACIRSDLINVGIHRHNFSYSNGNDTNVNVLDEENVRFETSEAPTVEGFLESLNEVFNENDETTTEELQNTSDFNNEGDEDESTTEAILRENASGATSSFISHENTVDGTDFTNSGPQIHDATTTPIETTPFIEPTMQTATTTMSQNTGSCESSLSSSCMSDCLCSVTCSNMSSSDIVAAAKITINSALNSIASCDKLTIDLTLKHITFDNDYTIKKFWMADLDVPINSLSISGSTIKQIAGDAFKTDEFSNMVSLIIENTYTDFYLVTSDSFNGLTNLKTLMLFFLNSLTAVNVLSLRPLGGTLTTLTVNRLNETFNIESLLRNASLTQLELLTLQYNDFEATTFNGNTFSGVCGSVERINLANSKVTTLEATAFDNCNKLSILELKNNNIESLPFGIFDDLPALKNLLLHNNRFTFIPYGFFTNVVKLPNLTFINLLQNPWHCDLNIAYLKGVLLTKPSSVLMSINACESPDEVATQNITDLWCSFDSCIIFCSGHSNRNITSILSSYNDVNCESVELILEDHHFEENIINTEWLSDLTFKIESLKINETIIEGVKNGTFNSEFFRNLKKLVIECNSAGTFPMERTSLNGLKSLQIFVIKTSNVFSITAANKNLLSPVSETLTLLSINNIVSSFKFADLFDSVTLKNLKSLKLHGNNFSTINITTSTFKGIHSSLEEIYLNNSKLTSLSSNAFSRFEKLRLVHLEDNNLKTLGVNVFGNLINDEFIVYLGNNPWNCDCEIEFFIDIISDDDWVTCSAPENYNGTEVIDAMKGLCRTTPYIETSAHTETISSTTEEELPTTTFSTMTSSSTTRRTSSTTTSSTVTTTTLPSTTTSTTTASTTTTPTPTTTPINCELFFAANKTDCENKNGTHECEFLIINDVDCDFSCNCELIDCQNVYSEEISKCYGNSTHECESVVTEQPPCNYSCDCQNKTTTTTTMTPIDCDQLLADGEEACEKNNGTHVCDFNVRNITICDFGCDCELIVCIDFYSEQIENCRDNDTHECEYSMNDEPPCNFSCNNCTPITTTTTTTTTASTSTTSPTTTTTPIDCDSFLTDNKTHCETHNGTYECKFQVLNITNCDFRCNCEPIDCNEFFSVEKQNCCSNETHECEFNVTEDPPCNFTCFCSNKTAIMTTTEAEEGEEYSTSTRASTTTSELSTDSTTTTPMQQSSPGDPYQMTVPCFPSGVNETRSLRERLTNGWNLIKTLSSSRDPIVIFRPPIQFVVSSSEKYDQVMVEFESYDANMVLLYYPSEQDPFYLVDNEDERHTVRCIAITGIIIFVDSLAPDTVYTFCALYRLPQMFSPFQCKTFVTKQGHPWLYDEQKAIIITAITMLILLALVVGIIMTYFLIRRIPSLIKGSKRVVMVNNRAKDVMILPRSNSESRSNSCRKESITPITAEPPTYMTPLPRHSIENRPPFIRSTSDTSLKSYVSVSRLPPRFSQVFQHGDFGHESARRCGSFPHCHPSAPCHQSPEMPPPLPRRSVVSTASSTHHSNASTAEIGKPLSRASCHNSTYRRQPRSIEIEQENHYNLII